MTDNWWKPKRCKFKVIIEIDLDSVPGAFHQSEDWLRFIKEHNERVAPHYNPEVTIEEIELGE